MAASAYAHEARLVDLAEDDAGAPGAAITVELCGHWDHDGACRWPHYTSTAAEPDGLRIRTLFACSPDDEAEVRSRIDAALAGGLSPIGATSQAWRLASSTPAELRPDEAEHAERLAAQG